MQNNIHKVLIVNQNQFLNQQEVWEFLLDMGFVEGKDPVKLRETKRKFLDAFLTMSSNFDDIIMKINDDDYFIAYADKYVIPNYRQTSKEENLVLSSDTLLDHLVESGQCIDEPIDSSGNTVLHKLVKIGDVAKVRKYLEDFNPDITLKNYENKTAYDVSIHEIKTILDIYLLKKEVHELKEEINNSKSVSYMEISTKVLVGFSILLLYNTLLLYTLR